MTKKKKNERRNPWHVGFYSGVELELREYRAGLRYETEHELSRNPLRIDMLVIRKGADIRITNPIATFFKKHNIIEYKSPNKGMNIDDLYKAIGYAGIYKSLGHTVNEIPVEDITISLFQYQYPRGLFKELKRTGARVVKESEGIYRIDGVFTIPIRVVVTSMLPKELVLMRILSDKVEREDVVRVLTIAARCKEAGDRELIRSVLEISAEANVSVFREVWEDESMGSALREIMKDDLDAKWNEGVAYGRRERDEETAWELVDMLEEKGKKLEAVDILMTAMGISKKEAKALMVKRGRC